MKKYSWSTLSSEELLKLKFSDLKLILEDTRIYNSLLHLKKEMSDQGFIFSPEFFISDGWFVSLNYTGIAIPFYLLHPRLMSLEIEMMGKIEGHTGETFHKLLRHELGHSIDHAYKLQNLSERKKIFGSSKVDYPTSYKPNYLAQKKYVEYLGESYASSHPDEDWAETFAVWFDQKRNWKKIYANSQARFKLDYIDSIIEKIKTKEPICQRQIKKSDLIPASKKLGDLYRERIREEQKFYHFKTQDLASILVRKDRGVKASLGLISTQKKNIKNLIAKKTGSNIHDVEQVLKNLDISLKRKGWQLKIKNKNQEKILLKHFDQFMALYIGKEKNNILM